MRIRRAAPLPFLLLTAASTTAQTPPAPAAVAPAPVKLSENDVWFQWRVAKTGMKYQETLCGFHIEGNHLSSDVPRPEWDLNIDQLPADDKVVVGVSAGAFVVTSKDKHQDRQPRPPITALSFTVAGNAEPISARIVGPPSAVNAIRAIIDTEPAARLFSGFYDAQPVTISITYQDGATDQLLVENWKDHRKFAGDKNGYLHQCEEGMRKALPAPGHIGSRL
jgi:hypothetical protein